MGSSVGLLATEDEGLIPRVLRSVFDHLDLEQKENDQKENDQGSRVTNLRLSFVEIYNEEIRCSYSVSLMSSEGQIFNNISYNISQRSDTS
jgi:hypothetical protein